MVSTKCCGDIPNPIEWLVLSDKEYDAYSGEINVKVSTGTCAAS